MPEDKKAPELDIPAAFKQVAEWFARHPERIPEKLKNGKDIAYGICSAILWGYRVKDDSDYDAAQKDLLELYTGDGWEGEPEPTYDEVMRPLRAMCRKYGHGFCQQHGFTGKFVCPVPEHRLTTAELEVLSLLAEGYDAKYVADARNVSEQTVATQRKSIYKKLNVETLTQALNKVSPDANL